MSSRRKKSSHSKPDSELAQPGKPAVTLPTFILIVLVLLASAGIWSVTRNRTGPIVIDLVDNGSATIAAAQRSNSWNRLDEAAQEVRSRLEGKKPAESMSLLQILEAIADRQTKLAESDRQKTTALANRLLALQGLAAGETDRELMLQRTAELSTLSTRYKNDPDDDLARQALRCAFVASQLTLRDGVADEEDSHRLVLLITAWIRDAAERFPTDVSLTRAIGDLLNSYPAVSEREAHMKAYIEAVQIGYGRSQVSEISEWANYLAVKQFFDEFGVVRQLADTLLGDASRLQSLQDAAEKLLTTQLSPVSVQTSLELAQFLEGVDQPSRAQSVLEKLLALDLSSLPEERREKLISTATRMQQRLALYGEAIELKLQLDSGPLVEPEQLANSVVLLLFYETLEDLEKNADRLGVLQRLKPQGLEFFLLGPELAEADQARLLNAVFRNDANQQLPFVTPSQSAEMKERFWITYTPFPVILDQGKVVSQGTPLTRGLLWLEKRLFEK